MSTDGVDTSRRRFLTAAATVVGGVGAAAAVVPFLASMNPSERAKAAGAPVEADISKLEPGQRITVEWRGKPVWIVRRTEQNLSDLASIESVLLDPSSNNTAQQPDWAKNEVRSSKPEYLVVVGICTHLGCSPTFRPEIGPAPFDPDWKGGFFCPCHGSKFDLAGRVFAGVPAPKNLEIPPYTYLSDSKIMIGVDQGAA
ncbi:ubiquinol-cytochrome c reductase iron-sulfur subunit [Solemya pervernicosa gill symbiont]|uniref:Ubiquinol-cytochrome c reductase iron-sulfur subunit n=2 Tax=Gammaproteobacteria incertae sedis TaxID=118884 RepID=A0A1T2LA97_9GAMM|nr:ubiquinol-cytochrome c reductase iron-sulfur subunit [Candidatus Reidiella endopervernicosa]OOZ41866.1 ubiquinol-cytochrome c reductase iron-sulfur subunit [Solemya pervernicosa gill symbiont]QKQ26179.1 ubiquinol-cytochrome c reductase iron-sulfur subunit [Candidatus Reidiella endopervernicosa]